MSVTAVAHSNIALVKYWGKRAGSDPALNLPDVGSISITLGGLSTRTTVSFEGHADEVILEGGAAAGGDKARQRILAFVSRIRRRAGMNTPVRVVTQNDFPTGAGLASSASGFAALALAASQAAGLQMSGRELSQLARCGSGSAARSLFGGFVELHKGDRADGDDCFAEPLLGPGAWPLEVLVAVTSEAHKAVGSTEGMNLTRDTSPYYSAWVTSQPQDLALARSAIAAQDFAALAEVTEGSCLTMHGLMLSSRPGLLYWKPATVAVMELVREARAQGIGACFTIDAGPQVKVVCAPGEAEKLCAQLESVPGVLRVLRSPLGGDARVVEDLE